MQPLNESQQVLAEDAHEVAERIAKRYARIFPEYEQDLESAANYGAVRAAASYVPEMNGVWERWTKLCIKGEIKDFLVLQR
jgi:DNA-directed RNA polymerase specialized sigma subunit